MRQYTWLVAGSLGCWAGLTGCPPPEESDHLPPAVIRGTGGSTTTGGSFGSSGGSPEGGAVSGIGGGETTTTLEAPFVHTILGFNTEFTTFVNQGPAAGETQVRAPSRDGELAEATVPAQESVELSDVLQTEGLWVEVVPRGDNDTMGVFQQVDTTDNNEEELYVMPRSVMEDVMLLAGLTLDDEAAHVCVRAQDEDGYGRSGAAIQQAGGDAIVLIYDGSGWSSAPTQTEASGLACVVNLPVTLVDGEPEPTTISVGGTDIEVPVRAFSVTLLETTAE